MNLKTQLKQVLTQWSHISNLDFALVTPNGKVYIQTAEQSLPSQEHIRDFFVNGTIPQVQEGPFYYKIQLHQELLYLLLVWGAGGEASTIGELAVCQITSLLSTSQALIDKNVFLCNYLAGKYSRQEIASHIKRLHIKEKAARGIFLIETETTASNLSITAIKHAFPFCSGDFITSLDTTYVLFVKELGDDCTYETLEDMATTLVAMLNTEVMTTARVAYSDIAYDLQGLSKSYKDALTAMEVGKIFTPYHNILGYRNLGIGHLIYQLPLDICDMFIQEALHGGSLPDLDEESLRTIEIFFENNLNLSETSRQLYLHRNTLVYRFEKIQKKYGLDIRTFEDAMTFKIAMMIVNYMKYKEMDAPN